ncbi:hypothetical protein SAV14893_079800 [Streptomyces avermitilis]|uniref:Uncharacterized protein n=1 Tax=Streptomyces avermitilis TaxID=33903 RepID=A0A4D4MAW9_STRAX|nr:hypothetical protein SAV14893_079800 [Streptomyces avermitilis]
MKPDASWPTHLRPPVQRQPWEFACGELDEAARTVLTTAGARSPFLGYQPSLPPSPSPR